MKFTSGLSSILKRPEIDGDLNSDPRWRRWQDALSPGEAQRMAFMRWGEGVDLLLLRVIFNKYNLFFSFLWIPGPKPVRLGRNLLLI